METGALESSFMTTPFPKAEYLKLTGKKNVGENKQTNKKTDKHA